MHMIFKHIMHAFKNGPILNLFLCQLCSIIHWVQWALAVLCLNVQQCSIFACIAYTQCYSCLFVSGRTVAYRSHFIRPQFPPKVDFGAANSRLQASHLAFHVDWPSRTLLTVRPAWQDGVLPRRMTNYSTAYAYMYFVWICILCWVQNNNYVIFAMSSLYL